MNVVYKLQKLYYLLHLSIVEDASGNVIIGDKIRSGTSSRMRAGTVGFRSESHDSRMRRNGSDNSVGEQGHANDSGIDTAVSKFEIYMSCTCDAIVL